MIQTIKEKNNILQQTTREINEQIITITEPLKTNK